MFIQTLSIPKLGTRLHIEVTFDGEQRLFFEGVVARQKIVAAELRHVLKGGFGVRFLAGVDLLSATHSLGNHGDDGASSAAMNCIKF